jgi:hypothetical protein
MRMMPEMLVFGDWWLRRTNPEADSQAIELKAKIDGLWR